MSTRQRIKTNLSRLFSLWLVILGFNSSSMAGECQPVVARIVSLQGQAEVLSTDSQAWRQVQTDSTFCPGDQLRVGANSRAGLQLNNDTFLRLSEQSSIRFASPVREDASWLELFEGIAHFISRITRPAQVNTPYVNASIEGTEFTVQVTKQRGIVSVIEGSVRAHNEQGESTLASGQIAEAAEGQPPVVSAMVNPLDAVQWALYYPAVIDLNAQAEPDNKDLLPSLNAYRRGDLKEAFAKLDDPSIVMDSSALAYRASLNLAVGRIEAARKDIGQLLDSDPRNADALALQSVIATIQNQRQEALNSAEQAVTANPQSVSAHITLSYARQARFELEQALDAAKQASQLDQGSALAWSRLSQLHLMFRQMTEATVTAQKAVAIDGDIALTQTTLGFAHLIRLDLDSARQAFEKAAVLDQASPMPRLGLGLVLIREGELTAGREMLETAANLDPGNALIRSYLGKAYYEEKRGHEAETQFQLAKQQDQLDPTAWFYDAILKQSENRPIEALEDLQHAIALNDNRAVYRSRLLLDEDQASRNASLARVYDDLGFQRLALKESWKSLSADPGNASAHRFLSDAYAGVPRHEIAQVSELLQAQLLQPEITVPVSPSASEANLLAFEGSGPSVAGFNEYNPMFNRQRLAFLANGVTGSNNTRGGEIVAGAFSNRGMLSAGHFRENSDGFRENNDSDQTITNVFGQFRITSDLSIQGEVKKRKGDFGDLVLRFDPDSFSRTSHRTIDSDTYRLGANYSPDSRNSFIISAIHQDLSDKTNQDTLSVDGTFDEAQYEGQYLFRGDHIELVSGLGFTDSDIETSSSFSLFGMIIDGPIEKREIEGRSGYIYTHIPWSSGTGILGLEYAKVDDEDQIDESQTSPKLGVVWDINETSTVRLAAFRTLQTTSTIKQSISPTQVAGFNQVFDDLLGTKSWRYAIALDSQIISNIYGGIEFTRRTVTEMVASSSLPTEDHEEEYHVAYISWPLTNNYAIGSRFIYDDFEREYVDGEVNADRPATMNTQSFSLLASYHSETGFYSELEAIHISQEIDNILLTGGTESESDKFWLGNISFGMRLPKRKGTIELQVRNLFDRNFNFQSIHPGTGTPQTSPYYPERSLLLHAQLWL